MKLCDYGCEREANYQLKNGKWCCSKNCRTCPVVRKKQSESHKGKTQSEETRKKIGKAMMGYIPWNKGIPPSEETRKKQSKSMMGYIPWNKGIPPSEETKKKIGESNKLTIKKINKKYPLFSKIEEIRYNPDKQPNKKEIQVHCKNHNCENSKERGGWFTPTPDQFSERMISIEKPTGFGDSHFYCSQHCKDTCPLYGLRGDPLKETNLPYTPVEWGETRRRAWERDNGLCQDCGKPGSEVHHIKPVKLEPFLALDVDNLVTLCEDCHKKYHKQGLINSTGNLANITCSPESQKFLNQK